MTVNDLQGPEGIFGQATVTSQLGTLLVPDSGVPVCVVNNDEVNSIYLGDSPSITAGQQTVTVLGPLNTCTFDGSIPIYGVTSPGQTVQALLFPSGTGWQPSPIQVVVQIADIGLATLAEQENQTTAIPASTVSGINGLGLSTASEQVTQNTAIPTNMLHSGVGVTTEIAALIATGSAVGTPGGVPLFNLYNLLEGNSATLGANSALTFPSSGVFSITQIGYEFVLTLGTTQNAAVAPITVVFQWTDSNSGLVTATQVYKMYASYTGAGGPLHIIEGHGPSNADQLTVTLTAGAQAIEYDFALLQTSRIYTRHEWRTQNASATIAFPTMTYISCVPGGNIFAAQTSPSLNNSSETYLLPFYVGTLQFWGSIAVVANAGNFLFQDALSSLSNGTLARLKTASNGDVAPTTVILPRDQCTLVMNNGTATASTMSASMIAQELQTS